MISNKKDEILDRIDRLITDKFGKKHGRKKRFAEYLGVSPTSITNYFKQNRTPNISVLKKISEKFDVSLDYLVLGKTDHWHLKKMKKIIPEFDDNDLYNLQETIKIWHELNKKDKIDIRRHGEDFFQKIDDVLSKNANSMTISTKSASSEKNTEADIYYSKKENRSSTNKKDNNKTTNPTNEIFEIDEIVPIFNHIKSRNNKSDR